MHAYTWLWLICSDSGDRRMDLAGPGAPDRNLIMPSPTQAHGQIQGQGEVFVTARSLFSIREAQSPHRLAGKALPRPSFEKSGTILPDRLFCFGRRQPLERALPSSLPVTKASSYFLERCGRLVASPR